mmetsp:Transcript_27692/g.70551  ORF Transcript_27692/g.70551 Transcript_27692/m.70551 type:complete len:296 (-) Transcript_27692:304-1191(-)
MSVISGRPGLEPAARADGAAAATPGPPASRAPATPAPGVVQCVSCGAAGCPACVGGGASRAPATLSSGSPATLAPADRSTHWHAAATSRARSCGGLPCTARSTVRACTAAWQCSAPPASRAGRTSASGTTPSTQLAVPSPTSPCVVRAGGTPLPSLAAHTWMTAGRGTAAVAAATSRGPLAVSRALLSLVPAARGLVTGTSTTSAGAASRTGTAMDCTASLLAAAACFSMKRAYSAGSDSASPSRNLHSVSACCDSARMSVPASSGMAPPTPPAPLPLGPPMRAATFMSSSITAL